MKVSSHNPKCAICGRHCLKRKKGWYCKVCNAYTETDVEIED